MDRALRALQTDYVNLLTLAWWNGPPPQRIVNEALRLRQKGKVRHLIISSHHRPYFEQAITNPSFDAIMVRRVGTHVRDAARQSGRGAILDLGDRISRALSCGPKQLSA